MSYVVNFASSVILCGAFLVIPLPAMARIVQFDASPTVACAPELNKAFESTHSDERLVTATITISAVLDAGPTDAIGELRYDIYAPENRIAIFDYLPKTTLSTDVVGNIKVQKADSDGRRAQISVDGTVSQFLRADASGGADSSQSTSKSYEVRPPLEAVAAAGTIHRGHGVYFKLRPSDQLSLEGSRQFQLVFRVPQDWRGDYLRASCRSTNQRGQPLGQSSFLIPIYDQNDPVAKAMAKRLGKQERKLLSVATASREEVRRIRYPTVAHELSLAKSRLPADWLTQILFAKAGASAFPFEQLLPRPLAVAATNYRRALHTLTNLPPDASGMMASE